ncbi:MAG TPA: NADPH:quinone reductase [Blastococcus sp.]|jgi:NADPH2:quinone reductase|nr:NADPH:quinone reductase [Blastococcus sp.]
MRAITYRRPGAPDVLELVDLPEPQPGPGEVRVRMAFSGVNPTDWKSRSNTAPAAEFQIPNQDGAGTVDAVGEGVSAGLVGLRVWIWEAAWQRAFGTAAEHTVVPAEHVVPLADDRSFELGAALGIPFLTAHRCLTLGESVPDRLAPGALTGHAVLVQGGAGAVGNAAIQLAGWAGATVLTTVSSPAKADLARAAGATHVIDYRQQDVVAEVRRIAPDGVAAVVEVNPAVNASIDAQVLAAHGAVAMYANDSGDEVTVPVRSQMTLNARWQFVLVYTAPAAAKDDAVEDVGAAVSAGAIRIGADAGLPLHVFPLAEAAAAHRAVEEGAVGKVLIAVTA